MESFKQNNCLFKECGKWYFTAQNCHCLAAGQALEGVKDGESLPLFLLDFEVNQNIPVLKKR